MKLRLLLIILFSSIMQFGQPYSETGLLYDDSQVAVINITMDPAGFTWMMENPRIDSLHLCTLHFKNAFIDSTVNDVGIRIRGNTSRDAAKKSLKISFNNFVSGREFYGVDKLNLNGEHNDPSIARSKLSWDIYSATKTKASIAAHAAVYINDTFMGVYISVEHIDDEFLKKNFNNPDGNLWKCLYPADLTYKGDNPDNYKYSEGFPAYELSTNEETEDYTQLARFIKILNQYNGSVFQDSLEKIFDIASFLKYEAVNVLIGGWDDYWSLMNNYYLYHNPSEDKFTFIPYDYDNTFGIDWFNTDWVNADPYDFPRVNNGSRPLIEKLLAINQYKDLYSHFVDFLRTNVINSSELNSRLDEIKTLISPYAEEDVYRTLDYGFTYNDFLNSFDNINMLHVKKGIKQFISERNSNISGLINYSGANPIVYAMSLSNANPSATEQVLLSVSAFDADGIDSIKAVLYDNELNTAGSAMFNFNPVVSTKSVEESDRWQVQFEPFGYGATVNIKVEVYDNAGKKSIYPRTGYVKITTPELVQIPVVVNEFMADNEGSVLDPAGEPADWMEIYNKGDEAVLLTGMYLSDSKTNLTKWQFTTPDLYIAPKGYLVVWLDEQFDQEGQHAGFKLSKGGEFIAITNTDGISVIDSLSFGPQQTDISFGRMGDGNTIWSEMSPTPGSANQTTDAEENDMLPLEFSVSAYPNPFNPSVTIEFVNPKLQDVKASVFDILGREIYTQEIPQAKAGTHKLNWNAGNSSTGVYFCRVSAGENIAVRRLMLVK